MRAPPALRVALLAAGCLTASCAGSGGDGGAPAQPACKPPPPGERISFSGNIQPIFDRSCALSGCHVPGSLGGNLDLSPGKSYQQLVNRDSFQQPRKKRVEPGNPNVSYLVMKVEGTPGISGLQMPQGCPAPPPGGSCPAPDDISAIRTWIEQCATNN